MQHVSLSFSTSKKKTVKDVQKDEMNSVIKQLVSALCNYQPDSILRSLMANSTVQQNSIFCVMFLITNTAPYNLDQ